MENKMAEVAKLFGVELNEEFGLKNSNFRYKLTTYGLRKRHITLEEWTNSSMLDDLLLGKVEIVKKPNSILDKKEKEYLLTVIKPFRDKVIGITKYDYSTNGEYIHIKLKRTISPADYFIPLESIDLPIFKRGIMYKGMELRREYSLKELEL